MHLRAFLIGEAFLKELAKLLNLFVHNTAWKRLAFLAVHVFCEIYSVPAIPDRCLQELASNMTSCRSCERKYKVQDRCTNSGWISARKDTPKYKGPGRSENGQKRAVKAWN